MSIFGVGGFGGFGGRFDADLSSKIDQLVGGTGNQTREQKLEAQLREMGVDPDKLPLKVEDAKRHVNDYLQEWSGDWDEHPQNDQGDDLEVGPVGIEFVGSSLGFSRVIVHGTATDYSSYRDDEDGYPEHKVTASLDKAKVDDDKQWRDLERVWEAIKQDRQATRFIVWGTYSGHEEPIQTVVQEFQADPKHLREGQVARLWKDGEEVYARMGGPFGDDVLTNLRTFQPISESGWVVTEVVED